ncbi:class I SAM-dependent methyltransferase [Candidatus Omnitrophota bacterium]
MLGLLDSGLLEDNAKKLWDDFWKRRNLKGLDSWSKRRMVKILSSYIKPGMSVLDAGCGTGFFSAYFISQGCNVYSMDYSEGALSIAKDFTKHRSKRYIDGNILDEKLFSNINTKFDIIFTDGLLEHYPKKMQEKVIMNMKNVKKEDGYMINFVPNMFSLWSMVRPFCMDIKERPFIMKGFLNLHRRKDLNVISSGGVNVLPFRVSPERLLGRYFGMLFYCVAI